MRSVPAAPFLMGCGDGDGSCDGDEMPTHTVTLSAYEIDESEVTQADFQRCVDAGVCTPPTCGYDPSDKPSHPVVCVTWYQAHVYCTRLRKRLPTEAEWEKAARGPSDGRVWPWGTDDPTCMYANFSTLGCGGQSEDVGSHPLGQSPYAVFDLAGNVAEWVADRYDAAFYAMSPTEDPTGPSSSSGGVRVYRGGSFNTGSGSLRASSRENADPSRADPDRGFRCAR